MASVEIILSVITLTATQTIYEDKCSSYNALANQHQNDMLKLGQIINDLMQKQNEMMQNQEKLKARLDKQDVCQTQQDNDNKKSQQNETQKLITQLKEQDLLIPKKYIDCADILMNNPWKQGLNSVYTIYNNNSSKHVFCDMTTEGGGWTVIQRNNKILDFDRNWNEYKNGFGYASGDYWIGNEEIHFLTTKNNQELRIDLKDEFGSKSFAKYSRFKVDGESNKYKLTIGGNSGDAGDGFGDMKNYKNDAQNGMYFSTKDKDNDKYWGNCATMWGCGWWYNSCFQSLLNTKLQPKYLWQSSKLKIAGLQTSQTAVLQTSQMMIRPK